MTGIAVKIFCNEGRVVHTTLSLEGSFSYSIVGATPFMKQALIQWLDSYVARKTLPLPPFFDLSDLSSFQQTILKQMATIPFGETRSYRKLAEMCGNAKGARAVGSGCGKNPFPLFYPCHRIVCSNGKIGGFTLDLEIKRRMLSFENERLSLKECPPQEELAQQELHSSLPN